MFVYSQPALESCLPGIFSFVAFLGIVTFNLIGQNGACKFPGKFALSENSPTILERICLHFCKILACFPLSFFFFSPLPVGNFVP